MLCCTNMWRKEQATEQLAGSPQTQALIDLATNAPLPLPCARGIIISMDPVSGSFSWSREKATALGRHKGPGSSQPLLQGDLKHAQGRCLLRHKSFIICRPRQVWPTCMTTNPSWLVMKKMRTKVEDCAEPAYSEMHRVTNQDYTLPLQDLRCFKVHS